MPTYFEDVCPGCRRQLRIRTEYRGLSICCNHCGHSFLAQPAEGSPPTAPIGDAPPQGSAARGEPSRRERELEAEVNGLRADLVARDAALAERDQQLAAAREQLTRLETLALGRQEELDRAVERQRSDEEKARGLEALRDQLMEEVQALRSRITLLEAEAERHGSLEQELDAARSERDRIDAERQEQANEAERLRAALREAECSRQEDDAEHRAAYGALEREFRAALGRWEADLQEWQARWQRAHEAQVEEARRRIREDRARGAAACRRLRGRLRVAELQALRACEAQQAESDRFRQEVETAQQERDDLRHQLESAERERDRLVGLLAQAEERSRAEEAALRACLARAEAAGEEVERRSRSELAELSITLESARVGEAAATRRAASLEARARRLRAGLRELRRANEADRLEQHRLVEALRAERESEKARWEARFNEAIGRSEFELRILREEVVRWRREAAELQRGREALFNQLVMVARERDGLAARLAASVAAPERSGRGNGTGNGRPARSLAVAPPQLTGIDVKSVDEVLEMLIPGVREEKQGGLPAVSAAGHLRNSAGLDRRYEPGRQVSVPRPASQELEGGNPGQGSKQSPSHANPSYSLYSTIQERISSLWRHRS